MNDSDLHLKISILHHEWNLNFQYNGSRDWITNFIWHQTSRLNAANVKGLQVGFMLIEFASHSPVLRGRAPLREISKEAKEN